MYHYRIDIYIYIYIYICIYRYRYGLRRIACKNNVVALVLRIYIEMGVDLLPTIIIIHSYQFPWKVWTDIMPT
jgi:hypothetical protein